MTVANTVAKPLDDAPMHVDKMHVDNSGISAQPATGDARSWTTCPLLRICAHPGKRVVPALCPIGLWYRTGRNRQIKPGSPVTQIGAARGRLHGARLPPLRPQGPGPLCQAPLCDDFASVDSASTGNGSAAVRGTGED